MCLLHEHACFWNCDEANRLNEQYHNIDYIIEDKDKVLHFLDIKIKKNKSGQNSMWYSKRFYTHSVAKPILNTFLTDIFMENGY